MTVLKSRTGIFDFLFKHFFSVFVKNNYCVGEFPTEHIIQNHYILEHDTFSIIAYSDCFYVVLPNRSPANNSLTYLHTCNCSHVEFL